MSITTSEEINAAISKITGEEEDYTSDLNAIQIAEHYLDSENGERKAYCELIFKAVTAGGRFSYEWPWVVVNKDAETCAKAFLRAKGIKVA